MAQKLREKEPLIYIEWCDAVNNLNPWSSIEDAKHWAKSESWVVAQVGFLLEETKEYILLASKKNLYNLENPEVGGLVKIPKTWVRKRKNL